MFRRSACFNDPDCVTERYQFADFLAGLIDDLGDNHAEWENTTLPTFLESLAACVDASHLLVKDGGFHIDADRPSWELFALLLASARGGPE